MADVWFKCSYKEQLSFRNITVCIISVTSTFVLFYCFIVLFFFYLFLIHCYSPFICFDGACDIKKKKNSVSREHEQNL